MSFTSGEIGAVLLVTLVKPDGSAHDLSTATTKEIRWQRADRTHFYQDAEFYTDGADGKLYYTTKAGDLDGGGKYLWQFHVELADGQIIKHSPQEMEIGKELPRS